MITSARDWASVMDTKVGLMIIGILFCSVMKRTLKWAHMVRFGYNVLSLQPSNHITCLLRLFIHNDSQFGVASLDVDWDILRYLMMYWSRPRCYLFWTHSSCLLHVVFSLMDHGGFCKTMIRNTSLTSFNVGYSYMVCSALTFLHTLLTSINPIQLRICGMILNARRVEKHNARDINELRDYINKEWIETNTSLLFNLSHSMLERCLAIVMNGGHKTTY